MALPANGSPTWRWIAGIAGTLLFAVASLLWANHERRLISLEESRSAGEREDARSVMERSQIQRDIARIYTILEQQRQWH